MNLTKSMFVLLPALCCAAGAPARKAGNFHGLDRNMGNLFRISKAETRSSSPENHTGEKGKGGMATLDKGVHGHQARELGVGWNVNPFVWIEGGKPVTWR